jgi:Domain of unknown function (DUF4136)
MINSAVVQVFTARTAIYFIVSALLLVLTGCASTRLVESQVTAFSTLPAAASVTTATTAKSTYRFERLPSQQADTQRRDQQEAIAQAALDKLGLQRVGDAPGSPAARYSVQMTLSMQRTDGLAWDGWGLPLAGPYGAPYGVPYTAPYAAPWWGSAFISIGAGSRYRHGGAYADGIFLPSGYGYYPQPYFIREVSLVLRDLAKNQVVYETRARHEGRWADSAAVLPAMLDAALQGFPTPPAGTRRVVVEISAAENSVVEDKKPIK